MFTPRLLRSVLLILAVCAASAACAVAPANRPPAASSPAHAPSIDPSATGPTRAAAAPFTVTDDFGRTVTINGSPQRIVSVAPSTTEIAFALGLGNRVVAVDSYSDYPDQAKSLPKIKTFPINLEQVVSFKPDLVLAAGITGADDVKRLADLKLTVLVVGSQNATFENVKANIDLVARVTGTEARAKQVTVAMQAQVDSVKAVIARAATKPRVYWELDGTDPAKPYTPGPGSFIDDMIAMAGGVNVAASAKLPYTQISAEQIVADDPQVIIMSDVAYGTTVNSVKARKGWSTISAIKDGKVYPIDDNIVSRPGPRLADGLAAAAKLIHPELFH